MQACAQSVEIFMSQSPSGPLHGVIRSFTRFPPSNTVRVNYGPPQSYVELPPTKVSVPSGSELVTSHGDTRLKWSDRSEPTSAADVFSFAHAKTNGFAFADGYIDPING
jgi:hypothetical protein